jgi:hypothetical protein
VTSISPVAPGARLGKSQDTSPANSRRPEPNSPRQQRLAVQPAGAGLRQPVEPECLQIHRPIEGDHPHLRICGGFLAPIVVGIALDLADPDDAIGWVLAFGMWHRWR